MLNWRCFERRTLLGFLSLLVVISVWVGSGFVAQVIFTTFDYKNSIAMTVYSLILGSVLLCPMLWRKVRRSDLPNTGQLIILGITWYFGQLTYLFSLLYTSMGTNSAIQATSTVFAFIFSMLLLKYDFRIISAAGVLVVIGGVTLTSIFTAVPVDGSQDAVVSESLVGISIAIASAALGGLFACLFKKWVKLEENSGIVFGLFSIVAVVLGIPSIVVCHFAGIQSFQVPCWRAALLTVADALLCAVIGNYFFGKCFVYLTPVVVAMGLTLTIPVSFIISAGILKSHSYPYPSIIGVVLIFFAVVLVSWDQARYEKSLSAKSEALDIQKSESAPVSLIQNDSYPSI